MSSFRLLVILGIVFVPTLYRATKIELLVSDLTGVPREAFVETLLNDYLILAPILLSLLVAIRVSNKFASFGFFVVAAALLSCLIVDVLIYEQFGNRLTLTDVQKYGSYAVHYILDFNMKFLRVVAIAVLVLGAATWGLWRLLQGTDIGNRTAAVLAVAIASTAAISWQARDAGYVHYRFYQNVISFNQTALTEFRNYGPGFAETLSDPFGETCAVAPRLQGPVVIYMVESLSSYHSNFFSGLNDWTPQLDKLAAENLALRDFYSNGFTTEDAELSLLTAEFPIYPPNSLTRGGGTHFAGYWNHEDSLASAFQANGYRSHFLTTSDLEFSSTGAWMEALGFDTVVGSEAEFYEGWPRFQFDSAPDAALIDRIVELIKSADDEDVPTFMFAKTASGHHPFTDPETNVQSEKLTFRYVDRQIGELHRRLAEQEFFETGHLIVVGDHRAMRPLAGHEVNHYGFEKAYTQIPAVVIGPMLAPEPRVIDDPFSQVDIGNTLMGLAKADVCTSQIRGAILGPEVKPPEFIIHRRGDWRNQFSIFAGDRLGVVTLNGDGTHFSGKGFDAGEQESIVEFINFSRVRADIAQAEHATDDR